MDEAQERLLQLEVKEAAESRKGCWEISLAVLVTLLLVSVGVAAFAFTQGKDSLLQASATASTLVLLLALAGVAWRCMPPPLPRP